MGPVYSCDREMERLWVRVVLFVAAAIVALTDLLYIVLINAQGESPQPYIARFVGGYLAVVVAMVAVSTLSRPEIVRIRVALRAASAGVLLVLGFLAAFSIGVLIVGAGLLVGFALTRTKSRPAQWWTGVVATLVSVGVLLAGFQFTEGLFF